ncbi:MAG: alanyl-tRNA editing protein, partial [Planctomycetaceae bacterium]|nr:alanyl-tRNA editing protein [Planctomycetaceae bacterium]
MSLPPTRRLYLDDPFTTAFTAKVVATGTREGRAFVELEATHFYPEAGGQLPDRGRLGGRAVVDVQEDGERVLHFLDGPEAGLAPGTAVAAEIDRATRLDHMQQHTGQHMLSAALLELFRIPTLSFHMGAEGSTIDLDAAELTAAQLEAVEDRVNLLIQEDRPVQVLYPDEAGLAALKLRKEPAVTGRLRVIEVEGFDHSACGGTHCTRTGQLGVLHLAHWERVRQKARLHFLVGMRAVRDHRIQNGRLAALSAML